MALHEAFQAYQGLWFGWSGKVAAHPAVHPKIIDKGQVQYAVMDLTSLDRQEYYNGFANRALWPIMHYRIGLSEFSRADYAGYLRVNGSFASALAHLIQPHDLVWVHDYHLIPLASELRAVGITNPIGYFHHVPWAAPEVFGALQVVQSSCASFRTMICGRADRAGCRQPQTQPRPGTWRNPPQGRPSRRRKPTSSHESAPIGIDVNEFQQAAQRSGSTRLLKQTIAGLGSRKLIIGVDRLDYSKGIPERMEAFERFLVSHPDQRGRVTYLQLPQQAAAKCPSTQPSAER